MEERINMIYWNSFCISQGKFGGIYGRSQSGFSCIVTSWVQSWMLKVNPSELSGREKQSLPTSLHVCLLGLNPVKIHPLGTFIAIIFFSPDFATKSQFFDWWEPYFWATAGGSLFSARPLGAPEGHQGPGAGSQPRMNDTHFMEVSQKNGEIAQIALYKMD